MAELSLEHLNKLPKWGWAVAIGGIGLAVWYFRRGSSTSAAAAAPSDTSQQPNTTTPTGGFCPQYATPQCNPPGVILLETDENGCPKPVCSTSLGGGGGGGGTAPVCHSVLHGGVCTVDTNCPGSTLRQIFTAVHQDVNCAVQWNPSAARHLGNPLDDALWSGFVVFY